MKIAYSKTAEIHNSVNLILLISLQLKLHYIMPCHITWFQGYFWNLKIKL